jgi:hypothetical protein
MTDEELLAEIEQQRSLMVAVATGGPRIQQVNLEYTERRDRLAGELARRGIPDANPYSDLWGWYGRWSAGDMARWQSRRAHLFEMYQPLIERVKASGTGVRAFEEPTGWPRVDRGVDEIRRRMETGRDRGAVPGSRTPL